MDKAIATWAAGLLITLGIVCAAVTVAAIIIGWKLFKKAGIPGWKALIPVVNIINWFKVMSDTDMFWGMLLTGGLLTALGYLIPSGSGNVFGLILTVLGSVICFVFTVYNAVKGAPRFGKSKGFAVGLILLPIVFYAILAFDKSTYHVS